MTLEEQINKMIVPRGFAEIEMWAWFTPNPEAAGSRWLGKADDLGPLVHMLMQDSPLEVCLTSPSEYIREYRKWYESRRAN